MLTIPLRTGRGGNDRMHWRAALRQKNGEKQATAWAIAAAKPAKPALPCVVTLTRVAPGNGLDDDQVPASLKYVRDELARWLGVDDKRRDIVRYEYRQERGPWAVRVEFAPMEVTC